MKIFNTRAQVSEVLSARGKQKIGFVPTMGALHEGHISLVNESIKRCEITVVSIFVNPTQFNDPGDLEKYPRTPQADIELLSIIMRPGDILFMPDSSDIYTNETPPAIDLGKLDRVMEGKHRPGHFNGVVRVVKILFDITSPDFAFFGQKDFQQLAIIRAMAKVTHPSVKIISCPILREPSGLAMSSRNIRLDPQTRETASIIYKSLKKYSVVPPGESIDSVTRSVISMIEAMKGFKIEYFEIVDETKLEKLNSIDEIQPGVNYFGCIAVFIEGVRLIDNCQFSFPYSKG